MVIIELKSDIIRTFATIFAKYIYHDARKSLDNTVLRKCKIQRPSVKENI